MDIYIRHIKYFLAVCKYLNFTKAANSLYISQPTLSQQIAELETSLGVRLFDRTRRSVRLTDAGGVLRRDAEKVLEQFELFLTHASELKSVACQSARLRVGVDLTEHRLIRMGFLQAANRLKAQGQSVSVDIIPVAYDKLSESFAKKQLDLAFFSLHTKDLERLTLPCKLLFTDSSCLWVQKDIAAAHPDKDYRYFLSSYDLFLLKDDYFNHHILDMLERMEIRPSIKYLSYEPLMCDHAEAGLGVSILPRSMLLGSSSQNIRAFELGAEKMPLNIVAIWSDSGYSELAQRLIELIADDLS